MGEDGRIPGVAVKCVEIWRNTDGEGSHWPNSRPSYVSNPWLKPEEHQSNFLTGREMLIADSMPMIVHEASITEKLDQLFNLVGKSSHKYVSI